MNKIPDEPMTSDELQAVLGGQDLETYRETKKVRDQIYDQSRGYINSDPSCWPDIAITWDTDAASHRYSLDGCSEAEFSNAYPDGLCLGWVKLAVLDRVLCRLNYRREDELWTVGSNEKLAFMMIYLSEGRLISPPFIRLANHSEICFEGGNHRYAVAKAIGQDDIPILALPSEKEAISKLVSVRWADA